MYLLICVRLKMDSNISFLKKKEKKEKTNSPIY
jgi:hypothetical protein